MDSAIEERPLEEVPPKAPMKASDGVLLSRGKTAPLLWKASEMPHDLQLHGVPDTSGGGKERTLYSVDSMAPMVWKGLAVLPQSVARELEKRSGSASFGTRRSVQGHGTLTVKILPETPLEWAESTRIPHTVLVLQSPVSIPDDLMEDSDDPRPADAILQEMAHRWLGEDVEISRTWANVGILFGWNSKLGGQQPARRVMLPGSVLQFPGKKDAAWLTAKLKQGFCLVPGDVQRGYGAVSVHPGKAAELFKRLSRIPTSEQDKKRCEITKCILRIFNQNRGRLPSPSQISALRDKYRLNKNEARKYFNNQLERNSVWEDWKAIKLEIESLLWESSHSPKDVLQGLEILIDLSIAGKSK